MASTRPYAPFALRAYPKTAMKWLSAVERLALRAVAPCRAARRLRPPGAGNYSGRPLCAGGVVAARPLPPPNGHATAMKWLSAVERLALRAVAPRRAARRVRPPGAGNYSGRPLCAGGVVAARPLPPPVGLSQNQAPSAGFYSAMPAPSALLRRISICCRWCLSRCDKPVRVQRTEWAAPAGRCAALYG